MSELRYRFELDFPIEWAFGDNPSDGRGGEPVSDAGTIYIGLWEDIDGDQTGEGLVVGSTTIKDMVAKAIDFAVSYDGLVAEEQAAPMVALMKSLRSAADMIEEKLPSAPPAPTPRAPGT